MFHKELDAFFSTKINGSNKARFSNFTSMKIIENTSINNSTNQKLKDEPLC